MTRTLALSLAFFSLLAAPVAFGQPAPPAPQAPPQTQPDSNAHKQDRPGMHAGHEGGGGMGIVPPGTWWKNPTTITDLTLTADQQKKLDDLFLQSRIGLIHLHASLEEEQLKLQPLLNANPPDQAKTLAQISKIADLRADLEKADAKMLLGLRAVLSADQWTKLQAEQHTRRSQPPDGRGQKRGPDAQGRGPGGPNGQGSRMPPPPAAQ